jgi:hypothetical protein
MNRIEFHPWGYGQACPQVRRDRRACIGLGQVPGLSPGDPGDAALAHQSGDPTPSDFDHVALELTRDTLGPVGRVCAGAEWTSTILWVRSWSLSSRSVRRAWALTQP